MAGSRATDAPASASEQISKRQLWMILGGPLLGGFFVDHLSWRWVFYINLPLGAVSLVVTAIVLPAVSAKVQHVIDYLGAGLVAAVATSLVLLTSLGGSTFAWSSPVIYGLGAAAAAALLAGFVWVEKRAAEPVLPPHLFTNRVFTACSAIGFVVGFAMFGAITYLPQYMEVVQQVSPTASGLRLLPMMGGLLLTSITSGMLITRTGRYKIFPILGTLIMAAGLFLLSRLAVSTPMWESSVAMFVLGVGIGAVLQVLVIAVQNSVDYRDLGTATSGVTFFRSIGGSFGTAIFGAIFANVLTGNLAQYLRLTRVTIPPGFSAASGTSPAVLAKLPPEVHAGFTAAYAASIRTVFLVAAPVALVAFALAWLLKEVPLRATAAAANPADTYAPTAIPAERSSFQEMERAVEVLARRENRRALYTRLAVGAGLTLSPRACWLLYRIAELPGVTASQLCERLEISHANLDEHLGSLRGLRLIGIEQTGGDEAIRITAAGADAVRRLVAARRDALADLLRGWSPDRDPELQTLVRNLAGQLLADDAGMLRDAKAVTAVDA